MRCVPIVWCHRHAVYARGCEALSSACTTCMWYSCDLTCFYNLIARLKIFFFLIKKCMEDSKKRMLMLFLVNKHCFINQFNLLFRFSSLIWKATSFPMMSTMWASQAMLERKVFWVIWPMAKQRYGIYDCIVKYIIFHNCISWIGFLYFAFL